ncbi:amidase family protein [Desemzia incerta]|uniref:amidase family protein n=1 Tax=Desemzia incerta TaxID=82801 RepID=UPI0016602C27|nr:amidase family protein [Desemzia incerta]
MKNNLGINAAKKSFIALKNPYQSVIKAFPEIISYFDSDSIDYHYVGVKNKKHIPRSLLDKLKENGNYLLHTVDAYSLGGRAIDISLNNPISGRPMTGSSSGTAINVLIGINDLGIGTDGGGSVLAPAMAVNLFGFISNLIEENHVKQFPNQSTDKISFIVSIGYMTRTFQEMQKAIGATFPEWNNIDSSAHDLPIFTLHTQNIRSEIVEKTQHSKVISIAHPDLLGPREPLISFLNSHLTNCDFLISEEGPIDYRGLGDTIIGHMGEETSLQQRLGNKGLVRVVNMANATAIVIPKKEFATAYVLICESIPLKIKTMLNFAEKLALPPDELTHTYLSNFDNYFPEEFI